MSQTTQTRSLSEEIRALIEQTRGREEIILLDLGFKPDRWGNIKCRCPIHNGDNPSAFSYSSKFHCWKCWTHQCEKDYGCSIFGLVRAVKDLSCKDAIKYIEELLNISSSNITSTDLKRKDYLNNKRMTTATDEEKIFDKTILEKASRDFSYMISRGFDEKTMLRFGGFYVDNPHKPMFKRICFPIYNKDSNIIGFTGRTTDDTRQPKWMHYPANIRSGNYLYGLEQNKEEIKRLKCAILTEGPNDVNRLSQAGLNIAVGTFGTNFSIRQINQLLACGVHNLVLCYDQDEAGNKGMDNIIKQAQLYFRMFDLSHILNNDPGKASVQDIQTLLIPEIKKICSNL